MQGQSGTPAQRTPAHQLAIRVDANFEIGSGHVVRCLTLASNFQRHGFDCLFLISDPDPELAEQIVQKGHTLLSLPRVLPAFETEGLHGGRAAWLADADATRALLKNYSPVLLVVDHYSLDARWEKAVATENMKTLVVDDLANRKHECDFLLDQNDSEHLRATYRKLVNASCEVYLGPGNVLLRSEFVSARRRNMTPRTRIRRVLIFYGASDATSETLKALSALEPLSQQIEIHVVIGQFNKDRPQILQLAKTAPGKIFIYENVQHIAEMMSDSDLALGAGGTSSWERCFLGLPTLITVIAENQRDVANRLEFRGCAISLGWHREVTPELIRSSVESLRKDKDQLSELSKKSYEIWEGSPDPAGDFTQKVVNSIMSREL